MTTEFTLCVFFVTWLSLPCLATYSMGGAPGCMALHVLCTSALARSRRRVAATAHCRTMNALIIYSLCHDSLRMDGQMLRMQGITVREWVTLILSLRQETKVEMQLNYPWETQSKTENKRYSGAVLIHARGNGNPPESTDCRVGEAGRRHWQLVQGLLDWSVDQAHGRLHYK